jgi:hypothetical protein
MEKLAKLMKKQDKSWVYTDQQLRSRIQTMKRQGGAIAGGRKRKPEDEKEKKGAAKKNRRAMLGILKGSTPSNRCSFLPDDDEEEPAESSSGEESGSGSRSDSDESGVEEPKRVVLRGRLAHDYLPLVVSATMVKLKGYFLLIWPKVHHAGFQVQVPSLLALSFSWISFSSPQSIQLLPSAPPRLKITVRVTEISDQQLRQIIGLATRSTRTFDEVEHADFANPAPLEDARLQELLGGDGDIAAALRKAIHRAPSAQNTQGPAPLTSGPNPSRFLLAEYSSHS